MINELLKSLCEVQSPSGSEAQMTQFILAYLKGNSHMWATQPKVIHGKGFQDCIILIFGQPKVAAFAHIDTTGFTVRYQDQLVPIGGPEVSGDESPFRR